MRFEALRQRLSDRYGAKLFEPSQRTETHPGDCSIILMGYSRAIGEAEAAAVRE